MNKRRVLIVVLSLVTVFLLAVPSVVTANPRDEAAWKRYVDEKVVELYQYIDQKLGELYAYVDEKIAEIGGGGPDYDLPADEDWNVDAYAYSDGQGCSHPVLQFNTDGCSWNGVGVTPTSARAMVSHDGDMLGYATGSSGSVYFHQVDFLPPVGDTIDLDIWVFWMGTEKRASISRLVTEPQYQAPWLCGAEIYPEDGYVPLSVRFTVEAEDDDPCDVLSTSWDFGDGGTAVAEMQRMDPNTFQVEVVHVYESPGIFYPVVTITDLGGQSYAFDGYWLEVYQ